MTSLDYVQTPYAVTTYVTNNRLKWTLKKIIITLVHICLSDDRVQRRYSVYVPNVAEYVFT